MLAKTNLHADMDGIVTVLNKEAGEMAIGAQFQEDVIMTVADLSQMEAAIEVDENDVINISLGDTAIIEIDAFVDTTFKGLVTQIANSATIKAIGTQEQVTNFEVVVTLLDYNQKFRPGMSTTVDILTETKHDVLRVPIQAVTVREKDTLTKGPSVENQSPVSSESITGVQNKKKDMTEIVFCVEEKEAVSKPIKLGISDDTHYEVLSGLNEGELVITGPFRVVSRTLHKGDFVEYKTNNEENKNDD
jgi:HlyD family secretion protein